MSLLLLFGPAGTAAPAGAPTLTARIDWENGGTFDSGIDSCAGRVLGGSWRRGRSADFNTDATGSASLILDNFDDRYTPDRNWCDNPSFESGVTGWSTTAIASLTAAATSIAQVTDSAPSAGTKAGEAVLTATLNSGVTYPIPYAFRAGVTYAVSVHLKSTAGALTVRAGLASSGTPADLASSGTDITTSWAAYTFAWTPTADRTDAVFFLRTIAAAAATVRIDRVQVNPGATANAYLEAPTKGQLVPGRPVHIYATYAATDYPQFYGFIERITPRPDDRTVEVACYDPLRRMADELAVSEFTAWTRSVRDCRRDILDQFERGSFNLIANPAFVADTRGWFPAASTTLTRITTDGPATETTCAEIYSAAGGDVEQSISLANRFPAKQLTRTSFYARSVSGSTTLTIRQPSGSGSGYTDYAFTLTTAWQRFSFTHVLAGTSYSVGIPSCWVGLRVAAGQTYRIGALMMTRGPQLHPYSRTGIGRAPNLAESGDFDLSAFAWQNAFRNQVGNPSFETDVSGWSAAGDAFVSAATSITRSTTYAKYGSASAAVAVTAAAQGVFYAITGTFKPGRVYQVSAWCAPPLGYGGSKPTLVIGSQGTPTDKAEILGPIYGSVAGAFVKVSTNWTPTADRTDVHVAIKPVNVATTATFWVDAVLVTELDYGLTYFDAGPSAGAHSAATTLALATVDSRTVYAITCPAVSGSGAAYEISYAAKTRFIGGVQYYLGIDIRASVACSVKVGLHINKGDGTFEEATTTIAATTAWQRATLAFTPTYTYTTGADDETALNDDSFLTVVANDTSAPIIYIDALRLAAESTPAAFLAASAVMPVGTESGNSVAAGWQGSGTVAAMLSDINGLVASSHYVAPAMTAPWFAYHVIDLATRNAAVSAETITEDIAEISGLEISRDTLINTQGYQIGSADPVYLSDEDSVGARGPGLGTLLSGTLYADSTLPDLVASDIIARYGFPRARPTIVRKNDWPSQLARQLGDVITLTFARQRIYSQRYSILSSETRVDQSGQEWTTRYILEEMP